MRLLFILLFPLTLLGQGSIILDSPFDSATELGGSSSTQWRDDIGTFDSGIVTDGTARQGTGYVRMTNDLGGIRAEITRQYVNAPDSPTGFYDWDVEYWVGYSIRVVEPASGYAILTQFRPFTNNYTSTNGTNPYTLRNIVTNGQRQLAFLWNTDDSNKDTVYPSGAISGSEVYATDYNLNEWVDIVMNINIHPDNGFVKLWVNGDLLIDEIGTTVYRYAADGTLKDPAGYVKLGLYYGPSNGAGEAHYDTFKVWRGAGGTYEDVSPLGLSPAGTIPIVSTLFTDLEQRLLLTKLRR